MSEGRVRNSYDREFKLSAVRLVIEKHQRVAQVARDLGVSVNSLHNWKQQFLKDSGDTFPGHGRRTGKDEELRRLKRELALVKEERDILKKVVGMFSETKR